MNANRRILLGGIVILLLAFGISLLWATSAFANVGNKAKAAKFWKPSGAYIWQKRPHDVGRFVLPVSNYGVHGQHLERLGSGGEWPAGSHEYYIFGAGIWIGGIVEGEDEPFVTVGYDPNSAGFEFVPGAPPNNYPDFIGTPEDDLERIYMSTDPKDVEEWPLRDANGEPIIVSEQDSYCWYNDLSIEQHADTAPLGILVIQTGYAWSAPGFEDIVFLKFQVINIREDQKTIRDLYVAPGVDPDIGDATDDMVGFDVTRNLAYVYDADGFEAGWLRPPGMLGYDFMESPLADRALDFNHDGVINQDSVLFVVGGDSIYLKDKFPGEQLGLAAFKKFTIQIDPSEDGERYLMMQGYDYRDTTWYPFDSDEAPEDKRFILTTGPIDLAYGDTATVVVGIMVGWDPSGEFDKNLEALRKIDDIAQTVYDAGFVAPTPPPPPNLTVIEGDKKVTLIWDNSPESYIDPYYETIKDQDPDYVGNDFEGYRIYRSPTGVSGTWELLAEFDKPGNPTTRLVIDPVTGERTEFHIGNNTGLRYFYVDSNLTNGVDYYYAVTSYDFQPKSQPVTLESAKSNKKVARPRTEPSAVLPPEFEIQKVAGQASFGLEGGPQIYVRILDRLSVTGHTYVFSFEEDDQGNLYWNLRDKDTDELKLEKQRDLTGTTWSPVIDGFTVAVKQIKDVVKMEQTAYGEKDTVQMKLSLALPNMNWRMANWNQDYGVYEIRFVGWVDANGDSVKGIESPGVVAACPFELWYLGADLADPSDDIRLWPVWIDRHGLNRIWDPDELVYVPYWNEPGNKYEEDWFSNPRHTDPVNYFFRPPSRNRETSSKYDLDYYFMFSNTTHDWHVGDVWQLVALRGFGVGDTFEMTTIPQQDYKVASELDKIKVVPNPFIISNRWMPSSDYGVIYFTNLPPVCTIRIFTISGDFVQELKKGYDEMAHLRNEGEVKWDLTSYNHQDIASGIYLAHIDAPGIGQKIIKFAVVK